MISKNLNMRVKTKPFILQPVYKQAIWGGTLLATKYGKKTSFSNIAESWECSTHPDGISIVASGLHTGKNLRQLIMENPEYLGDRFLGSTELPILIKFIDAEKDLSVQVHPNDEYALLNENSLGKTEMWYIVEAKKNASIIYGFNNDVNEQIAMKAIKDGDILRYLQKIPVRMGDSFFINAGTVHGIGAGTLIVEIQESSNITYRIFDYDRLDSNGIKRQLHIDKAMEVANFKHLEYKKNKIRLNQYFKGLLKETLCISKYFRVEKISIKDNYIYKFSTDKSSFCIFVCVLGKGRMVLEDEPSIEVFQGNTIFIPANSTTVLFIGSFVFLKITC